MSESEQEPGKAVTKRLLPPSACCQPTWLALGPFATTAAKTTGSYGLEGVRFPPQTR